MTRARYKQLVQQMFNEARVWAGSKDPEERKAWHKRCNLLKNATTHLIDHASDDQLSVALVPVDQFEDKYGCEP